MKGVGWFLVGRNLVLLAASLVLVFWAPSPRLSPAPEPGQTDNGLRSEPDL